MLRRQRASTDYGRISHKVRIIAPWRYVELLWIMRTDRVAPTPIQRMNRIGHCITPNFPPQGSVLKRSGSAHAQLSQQASKGESHSLHPKIP